MKSKVWKIKKIPTGIPPIEDFFLSEEEIPACSNDGDVIFEAESFIIDPYTSYDQNFVEETHSTEGAYFGNQVAKVIESRNEKYPVGSYLVGFAGWRERTKLSKEELDAQGLMGPYYPLPETGKHPRSTAMHVLGMLGVTAYFGVTKIMNPKPGDVCLVNGTAGVVGSVVAQMAKIFGCTVIGCAGSEKKIEWLKGLGLDHVFNYKTRKLSDALKEFAPNGINCYFDLIGGKFTLEVLNHMASKGVIVSCGYMENKDFKGSDPLFPAFTLIYKELRVQGFIMSTYYNEYPEAFRKMKQWMDQGFLKYEETKLNGFDKLPEYFVGQFKEDTIGKKIVYA